MAGKKGDQLPTIAWNALSSADLLTVFDASATGTPPDDYDKVIALSSFFVRMLSTTDISWMSLQSSFSSINSADGDGVPIWDASAQQYKHLPFAVIGDRLLSSSDLSWMPLLAWADIASGDYFFAWDATANAIKRVNILDLLGRLNAASTVDISSTPYLVPADWSGRRITNRGATAIQELDMPPFTVGMRFEITRIADFAFRVDPNGSETIAGGGAGKYLEVTSRGSVVLECLQAGSLEVVGGSATWTLET